MVMKVLLDPSVRRNSVTYVSVLRPKTVKWGDQESTIESLQRAPRHIRPDETFRHEQVPYIATIRQLDDQGKVSLYRSNEILMEDMRNRRTDRGYLGIDVLEGVEIKQAESPFKQSILIGGLMGSFGVTKDEQFEFMEGINDDRWEHVRSEIGSGHLADAFHLWTAEHNGLDAYVTMDKRFYNRATQVANRVKSSVNVHTPKTLCEHFGAPPTDLQQFEKENPPFA